MAEQRKFAWWAERDAIAIVKRTVDSGSKVYNSPSEIKKSVTDYGGSSKDQVRSMVNAMLDLDDECMSTDSSDSLAVALCHYNAVRYKNIMEI